MTLHSKPIPCNHARWCNHTYNTTHRAEILSIIWNQFLVLRIWLLSLRSSDGHPGFSNLPSNTLYHSISLALMFYMNSLWPTIPATLTNWRTLTTRAFVSDPTAKQPAGPLSFNLFLQETRPVDLLPTLPALLLRYRLYYLFTSNKHLFVLSATKKPSYIEFKG